MSRRPQNISEENGDSEITTLSEAAQRADEFAEKFAQLELINDPTTNLQRWLSEKSVVSKSSSFAERHQAAMHDPRLQVYLEIGRGYTGFAFEKVGLNEILKKAVTNELMHNLWNDFKFGKIIAERFNIAASWERDELSFPRTPRYYHFFNPKIPGSSDWWKQNKSKFPEAHQKSTCFFTAERILPLPKPMREAPIDRYCPPNMAKEAKTIGGNKDCLVRLYLGRRRVGTKFKPFFSLHNYQIHLDQALDICPAEINRFAKEMGHAFTIMQWLVDCDANDFEFVLGSAPTLDSFTSLSAQEVEHMPEYSTTLPTVKFENFKKRAVPLWMIDFDKVKKITHSQEGIQQAIRAAEENDPYFPKPGHADGTYERELWQIFAKVYFATSKKLIEFQGLKGCDNSPADFLNGWAKHRDKKVAKEGDR